MKNDKNVIKYLPNILSVLRLVLSSLLLIIKSEVLFVLIYLLCGLSDIADGAIARRWHLQSLLGARLDSVADIAMFAVGAKFLFFDKSIILNLTTLILIGCVIAVRVLNLVVVRVKFGIWASCHTYCNKLVGILVFLLVPIVCFCDTLPTSIAISIAVIALIAATEECAIVISHKQFNPDCKTFFDL